MIETTILLGDIDPIVLYGVNNTRQDLIKKKFPNLKIAFRGNKIKASGSEIELKSFEDKISRVLDYVDVNFNLNNIDLDNILENDNQSIKRNIDNQEIITFGINGNVIKAKTENQKKLIELSLQNDILFAIGPAGTGKTYTAVAMAVKMWKEKKVKRIVLTRPAVEAGENLGFLPGDLRDKVDPYLRPLYDALEDLIPIDKLNLLKESRIIEVAPLAFMRGRTLDNAFIILDEAQNATSMQLKMFLTRLGPQAKCIITGDVTQIDLPQKKQSGLIPALNLLKDINGIGILYLENKDIVRHKLVAKIIEAYQKEENNNQ